MRSRDRLNVARNRDRAGYPPIGTSLRLAFTKLPPIMVRRDGMNLCRWEFRMFCAFAPITDTGLATAALLAPFMTTNIFAVPVIGKMGLICTALDTVVNGSAVVATVSGSY